MVANLEDGKRVVLRNLGKAFRRFRSRDEREDGGKISILDYARASDTSWSTMQNLETGKGFPTVAGWCDICNKLQIDIGSLTNDEPLTEHSCGMPSAPLHERIAAPQFKITPEYIGEIIYQTRQDRGLSVEDFWWCSGVSKTSLRKMEKGTNQGYFTTLLRILDVYGIPLVDLLRRAEQPIGQNFTMDALFPLVPASPEPACAGDPQHFVEEVAEKAEEALPENPDPDSLLDRLANL